MPVYLGLYSVILRVCARLSDCAGVCGVYVLVYVCVCQSLWLVDRRTLI